MKVSAKEKLQYIVFTDDSWLFAEARERLQKLERLAVVVDSTLKQCPREVDPATVPNQGINSAPDQVIFNLSVSYARLKEIDKLLEELGVTG